jgi:signal transduction histidine kinase
MTGLVVIVEGADYSVPFCFGGDTMIFKKGNFVKYFYVAYVLAVFSTIICGLVVVGYCSSVYKDGRVKDVESICNLFVDEIRSEYEYTSSMYSDSIQRTFDCFTEAYDITIYVYDENGNIVLSSVDDDLPLSADIKEKLSDDKYLYLDSNAISKDIPMITYARRFYIKSDSTRSQRMYLTAYCSTGNMSTVTAKMVIVLVVCSFIFLLIIRFLLKHIATKFVASTKEFIRITEKYSKGDFSEKLDVDKMANLSECAKYVNALAATAENADETSKTFIANVSHELRTPMTTIGGFVDGILDGTIPKSHQQEYLILVSKEIKRLRVLITSMLNMTRYEIGTLKPNFNKTNLTDLVIQTVLMFEKKIETKNLEIEGLDSERITAEVDSDLIQQVIYNLVENAVKFVNTGGTISFLFEKNEDGTCTVGIRNTGEGLKNDEMQQLFDRFYKTDASRGKDKDGLGLGLSISRKIINLHHGTIVVKSVYGEYTEFDIHLPEKQK